MSDSILSGDFRVYYASENNQKRIEWIGSSTGTRTVNELYSALQNLFDDPSQMDDVVPIKADTPDIYRMQNQWFIDDTSVEHLTGGSIFSSGWKSGTTEHVLIIGYAPTTEFNAADIGRTIRGTTTTDTGTILDFNTTRNLIWIRPVDPLAAGDEFDNGSEAYTINNDAFGQVWNNDGGATWGNETIDANDVDNADWNIFNTGAATDIAYFGFAQKFSKLIFDNANGTAGTVGTVTWEYWNGSAWTALAGVTDGTSQFKAAVADNQQVTFTVPTNWELNSVNGSAQLYYVRADVGTAYTIAPVYDQGFVGGVGAGSFITHNRHGVASKAGESAWVGITTIGTIADNTHVYIAQEDPDNISQEVSIPATKTTSDWWNDGHIDLLLKVKEADNVIGALPSSSPTTAVATFFARQYTRTYSHFIATALATAGGNTVVPLSTAVDLDNPLGYRNLAWDNGSSETLVDKELLYNVGTTTAGNMDAVVNEAPSGTFVNDTTDANDVGGAGDVSVWQATEAINDALYFGKDNIFTLLMVDVTTQGVSSAAATVWEYYNGSSWATLTVTDDSNSGNGAFTAATGRRLISWSAPSNWARVAVTNQPLTAPTKLYYVRVRITAANYTTVPVLETAWVGGEKQLKARIADTTITTPAGATGNSDYYLVGDPITDFADNDVVIAGTSRKKIDIAGAPTNAGPASDTDITATHGTINVDVDENGTTEPYSIDINNTSAKTVSKIYERTKYLTRRGETATASTDGQPGQFYIGNELQVEYTSQASGNFAQGSKVYDQTTDAEGIIVADHDDGTAGDVILRNVRGTFTASNVLSDSPDPTYAMNTNSKCYAVDVSVPSIVDESADALSVGVGDVAIFVGTEEVNVDYFAVGAVKPFAKVIFNNTGGTAGTVGVVLWEYWNGATWSNLETVPNFSDGTTDFKAALGAQNLTFSPPVDWQPIGLSDGTVNSPTLFFIRARVTTVYTVNPVYDTIAVEDNVTATINGTPRAIAPVTGAPFGTYPGASKLFFAPGASPAPTEMATGEEQKFQTIDDNNNTKTPPNKQNMTVTNTVSADTVSVLRIDSQGGPVTKNSFTTSGTNNQSQTTLVVGTSIGSDNPTAGKVRVVSVSNVEHRYRYASFTSATFTLATGVVGGTSGGGNSSATRLHDTAGTPFANAEVGDFVRNITEGKVVRITAKIDSNNVDTETVTNWTGDTYDYNVLMEIYASGRNVYIPIIEVIADATSESATIVYPGSDINIRVDVRKAGTILPFSQDSTFTSTGRSIATVRSSDDIFA